MLSNTAIPHHYAEFKRAVLFGEVPVCREISMEMNRIDHLVEDPRYYYDDEAIDGFVRYCENECTLITLNLISFYPMVDKTPVALKDATVVLRRGAETLAEGRTDESGNVC